MPLTGDQALKCQTVGDSTLNPAGAFHFLSEAGLLIGLELCQISWARWSTIVRESLVFSSNLEHFGFTSMDIYLLT